MDSVAEESFASLLKRARLAARLSQEELAERARMSVRGISDLERGVRRRPRPSSVRLLADGLGLMGADRERFEHAGRDTFADLPARITAVSTSMVGRDALLDQIGTVLRSESRLISLVGPGGVGKTRVALAAADRYGHEFTHGAVVVALASVRDPGLVLPALGRTLGITDSVDRPLMSRLITHLRPRRLLVLLDNFEHLLAAASAILDVLAAAPGVKVLLTSRAVLHVSGERVIAVPPLDVEAAVQVFAERATAAGAGDLGPLETIRRICRRLDCLPLAIELAAARTPLLPPAALLPRLERSLDILTLGTQDAPERQRTLRRTIAWSYELLEPDSRNALRRCSVFVGGWSLEAADAVVGEGALDSLGSLIDRHMVIRMPTSQGQVRYTMLETIREFAVQELATSADADATARRHAEHFAALAESVQQDPVDADHAGWFERFELEMGNFRAALEWCLERGEGVVAARIASALVWPWLIRGHLVEGSRWLERVVASAAGADRRVVARAELALAMLSCTLDDFERATELAESAAKVLQEARDPSRAALAFDFIALSRLAQGDHGRARSALASAIELYRSIGSTWGLMFSGAIHARVDWAAGDYAAARAFFESWLPVVEAEGELRGIARHHTYLAGIAVDQSDLLAATRHGRLGFQFHRRIGDRAGSAIALSFLAAAERDLGRLGLARRLNGLALIQLRDIGSRFDIAWALESATQLEVALGRPRRALVLAGAAAAIRESIGAPLPPAWQARYAASLSEARTSLAADDAVDADAEGRRLSAVEAIDFALAKRTHTARLSLGALSDPQRDVARFREPAQSRDL